MAEAGVATVQVRAELDAPIDPCSLQAELERINAYLGTLDDNLDRLVGRLSPVLRDPDAVRGQAPIDREDKMPPTPPLTTRMRNMADTLSGLTDRVQFISERLDLP